MWFNIAVLFFSALTGGLGIFLIRTVKELHFKLTLVFAGSYLFSITITHIIPELFIESVQPFQIGLFLLIGFFMQFLLELLTSGVEHGHVHHLNDSHSHSSVGLLIIGLSLHSVMEGSLLAHPSTLHSHHDTSGLLLGIVFHKIPAAFALMSLLMHKTNDNRFSILMLLIFALASPLGLFIGDIFTKNDYISDQLVIFIFAIVSGNFLKISTTILFESSPNHRFNLNKMIVSLIGAGVAILIEFLFR